VVAAAADASPVGALHTAGAVVVNCAAVADVVPEGQVALTLQSYKEEAIKPLKLADVPVCAVEKLVQVADVFNL
jgi:hypothetical protein